MKTLKIKYRKVTRSIVKRILPKLAGLVGKDFALVDISTDSLSPSIMKRLSSAQDGTCVTVWFIIAQTCC